jgi:hypothetical protein
MAMRNMALRWSWEERDNGRREGAFGGKGNKMKGSDLIAAGIYESDWEGWV